MFGDAVDMRNLAGTACGAAQGILPSHVDPATCPAGVDEFHALWKAALRARAFLPEDLYGPCGLGCVHADWRYVAGPFINP